MAAIAGAGITLQLSLTRLFSLVVWYHFAFLAIAVAMLGLSLGGLISARRAARPEASPERDASIASVATAGAILLLLLALPRMPFSMSILASAGQFALYVALVLMVLAPFTGVGFAISRVLGAAKPTQAGALYGADLAGSGVAGALSVVAMDHLGGGAGACAAAALFASLAAWGFSRTSEPADEALSKRWFANPRLPAIAAVASVAYALIARDPLNPIVYARNAKVFPRVERAQTYERTCTSVACVDFFANPLHLGMWGREGVDRSLPDQVGIVIDGWAITSIVRGERAREGLTDYRHPMFDRLPTAFAQQVRVLSRNRTNNTLVIGAGGGLDVRAALHFGVQAVDAVEINPAIERAVRGRFASFSGDLFADPRVRLVLGEGRSVLERTREHYDLVQLSGVDTYAASQAGAFALTENYLYTVEAIRSYLDRLTPEGTLTLTRWLYHPDRQTIRLLATIDEATRASGLGDAGPRTFIAATPAPGSDMDFSMVLVQRRPFNEAELRAAKALCRALGYRVAWSPDEPARAESPFREYFSSSDRRQWLASYPFRIEPTTDDAPFFFEHTRLSKLLSSRDQILGAASGQLVLIVSALLVALFGALILWASRKGARDGDAHLRGVDALYFVLLGVAYLGVETAMIPRVTQFLGYPTYALTVVLSSLLVGSGIGSALSSRAKLTPRRATVGAAAAVSVLALVLPSILAASAQADLYARIAIASLTVGAVGLVLGAPFPTGLAVIAKGRSERALDAWVINGVASSIAGVVCLIGAIERGFTAILWASALAYGVAAATQRQKASES